MNPCKIVDLKFSKKGATCVLEIGNKFCIST